MRFIDVLEVHIYEADWFWISAKMWFEIVEEKFAAT